MSHRDGLRGFASLRTHQNVPLQALVPAKRHCVRCGAVLSRGNATDTCRPCSMGEIDIPLWALGLARGGCGLTQIVNLMLATDPIPDKPETSTVRDRNEVIRRFYAKGYSQYDLAKSFGLSRLTIADIVSDRYGREGGAIEKGKSRPEVAERGIGDAGGAEKPSPADEEGRSAKRP